MKHFAQIVARNSMFGLIAQFAVKLLSFGFSILIVRNLGAGDYGQYAAVLAFGALFVFVADLGLSPYAVREVARWRDAPDGIGHTRGLFGNLLLLRFFLALLAAALLIGTAWATGRPPVMVGAIALGTIGLLMYSAYGACEALLSGFERLDLVAGTRVIYQLAFVLVGTAALLLGTGYYGLIGANLCGIAIMTAVCWRSARRLGVRPGPPTPRLWPSLVRSSLPFGLIGFTLGISYKFDSVLLNMYRGDVETGHYNAAYSLVFSCAILSNIINTSLYPSLTRHAASHPASLGPIYGRALRYLLLASLPMAMGASLLADQIVPFLYGASYLPAIPALAIVIWVTPLMFVSEFLGYVVLIDGHERRAARAIVISTMINALCNLLLVPRFGFIGASVMTVLTEAVLVGQYAWMLRANLRGLPWSTILLRPIVAVFVMGALVVALRGLPLLLNVAIGAAVYVALLLVFGVVGRDELVFMRGLRRRGESSI